MRLAAQEQQAKQKRRADTSCEITKLAVLLNIKQKVSSCVDHPQLFSLSDGLNPEWQLCDRNSTTVSDGSWPKAAFEFGTHIADTPFSMDVATVSASH